MTEPPNGYRYKIDEVSRRLDALLAEFRETAREFRTRFHNNKDEVAGLRLLIESLPELRRRVDVLETHKELHNLGVQESKLENLEDDVRSLKRALYTFMFSVVASAIVIVITAFTQLGAG